MLLKLVLTAGVIYFCVMLARKENRSPFIWGMIGGLICLAIPFKILSAPIAFIVVFLGLTLANILQR
ncbi:MAG: hypothetical protein CMJ46_09455 [Planctomyces sp.]|nr:hypothetical protein [Planctomyces sp.]